MPWSNQNGKPQAWGKSNGNGDESKGPWGVPNDRPSSHRNGNHRPSSGDGDGPDLKDFLKKGQEKFQNSSNKGYFLLLSAALIGLWLFQCFYIVQQNERAIQLWLGKPEDKILTEGLHFRFWPFETYYTVPLTEQNISIGYSGIEEQSDSLMLSGDQNIVNVRFLVYYTVEKPVAYLFNLVDPVGTIRQVAESAMREVVGRRPIDDVYRDKREEVADDVLHIIQATVDKYGLGVKISRVSISEAAPPRKVAAAFNAVQQAEQERNRVIEEGNKVRATKLGLANGEAARKRAEATGEKARMIEEAHGQAQRFAALSKEESENSKLVRYRLYMETMGQLLSHPNKIIFDSTKNGAVPYLPLNKMLEGDASGVKGQGKTSDNSIKVQGQ